MRFAFWWLTLFALLPLSAQIWPDPWQGSKREKVEAVVPKEPQLWAEFGGEAAERAVYNGPVGKFEATAYRMQDATGALSLYQAIRPENAVPVRGAATVATTPGSQVMAHQNYVFVFEGWRPLDAEMAELYKSLPRMRAGGGWVHPGQERHPRGPSARRTKTEICQTAPPGAKGLRVHSGTYSRRTNGRSSGGLANDQRPSRWPTSPGAARTPPDPPPGAAHYWERPFQPGDPCPGHSRATPVNHSAASPSGILLSGMAGEPTRKLHNLMGWPEILFCIAGGGAILASLSRSQWGFFLWLITALLSLLVFWRLGLKALRQSIWRLQNRLTVAYLFIGVVPFFLLLVMAEAGAMCSPGRWAPC